MATIPGTLTDPNLISDQLGPSTKFPTKPMRYEAQVVWCFPPDDPGIRRMAEGLHGKRFAAGDATAETRKSAIFSTGALNGPNYSLIVLISGFISSLMECCMRSKINRLL